MCILVYLLCSSHGISRCQFQGPKLDEIVLEGQTLWSQSCVTRTETICTGCTCHFSDVWNTQTYGQSGFGMMEAIASHHFLKSQSLNLPKIAAWQKNHEALQQMHLSEIPFINMDKHWISSCQKKTTQNLPDLPCRSYSQFLSQATFRDWAFDGFFQRNPRSCDWRTNRIPLEYQFPQDQWCYPTLHVSFIARSSWKSRKQHVCK